LVLEETTPGNDFAGMAARFAVDTQVLVPQTWLDHPASSLPQVISVASASGVSPLRAQLKVSADPKASVTPDKSFLAFALPVTDSKQAMQVDDQGRLRINHKDQVLLDVQQLNNLASLQVVEAGSQHGLVYQALGTDAPTFSKPILLTRGDTSILGNSGVVTTLDSKDPNGAQLIDDDEPKGLDAWREPSLLWLIPGGILLFLVLLLAGRSARRNRQ
jgi:hypothetical protein